MICQLWSTNSASALRCSSSRVASFFSSAVTQYCISVHDSITFMVVHIPSISSSQLVSHLYQDRESVMNRCGPGLNSILMLSWCIHSSML